MEVEAWFPTATLIVGLGVGFATEVYRDRHAAKRERRARQDEQQRTILLELQTEIPELRLWTSRHWDFLATPEGELSADEQDEETVAASRYQKLYAKVELLASRVEDEETRSLALKAARLEFPLFGEADLGTLDEACDLAFTRIGKLLRERY